MEHFKFGQCRATSKRSGEQCKRPARRNGVCYIHGGATPEGEGLPQTRTIEFTNALERARGADFAATYDRAMNDPELLALTSEIALHKARITELLTDDSQSMLDLLPQLQKAYRGSRDAYHAQNEDKFWSYFNELGDLIGVGMAEHARWTEFYPAVDNMRKLVTAEQQRRVTMAEFIAAEDMMAVLLRIGYIMNAGQSLDEVRQQCLDLIQELIGTSESFAEIPRGS